MGQVTKNKLRYLARAKGQTKVFFLTTLAALVLSLPLALHVKRIEAIEQNVAFETLSMLAGKGAFGPFSETLQGEKFEKAAASACSELVDRVEPISSPSFIQWIFLSQQVLEMERKESNKACQIKVFRALEQGQAKLLAQKWNVSQDEAYEAVGLARRRDYYQRAAEEKAKQSALTNALADRLEQGPGSHKASRP